MADSFNKKDRERKRQKKKKEKAEKRQERKAAGKQEVEFMYLDENGNLSPTPPDPTKKKVIKAEDININVPKREALAEIDPIRNGRVKFFNYEKGYGFLSDAGSSDSYFVHIDNITGEVSDNAKVTFEIGSGPKGPVALKVKILD